MKQHELVVLMQKLQDSYRIEFTERQVALWVEFFGNESKDRFAKAVNKAIAYYTKMPNIAEMNKVLNTTRETTPL